MSRGSYAMGGKPAKTTICPRYQYDLFAHLLYFYMNKQRLKTATTKHLSFGKKRR
jgi:hypothetical protein